MRIREELGIFGEQLSGWQQGVLVGVVVLVIFTMVSGWGSSFSAWNENRKLEREIARQKAEMQQHLDNANKIAREKVEAEKKLAITEAQRDGKQTEAEQAAIATFDDRLEYERALRERRGDNPTVEQQCAELAALGYPCY